MSFLNRTLSAALFFTMVFTSIASANKIDDFLKEIQKLKTPSQRAGTIKNYVEKNSSNLGPKDISKLVSFLDGEGDPLTSSQVLVQWVEKEKGRLSVDDIAALNQDAHRTEVLTTKLPPLKMQDFLNEIRKVQIESIRANLIKGYIHKNSSNLGPKDISKLVSFLDGVGDTLTSDQVLVQWVEKERNRLSANDIKTLKQNKDKTEILTSKLPYTASTSSTSTDKIDVFLNKIRELKSPSLAASTVRSYADQHSNDLSPKELSKLVSFLDGMEDTSTSGQVLAQWLEKEKKRLSVNDIYALMQNEDRTKTLTSKLLRSKMDERFQPIIELQHQLKEVPPHLFDAVTQLLDQIKDQNTINVFVNSYLGRLASDGNVNQIVHWISKLDNAGIVRNGREHLISSIMMARKFNAEELDSLARRLEPHLGKEAADSLRAKSIEVEFFASKDSPPKGKAAVTHFAKRLKEIGGENKQLKVMEDLRSTLLGSKKWDLNHLKFIVNAANELDKNPQTSQAVWTWIDAFANAHASTPDPSLFSELATLANDPNAGGLSDRLRQKAIHLEFIDCKEITKKIGT